MEDDTQTEHHRHEEIEQTAPNNRPQKQGSIQGIKKILAIIAIDDANKEGKRHRQHGRRTFLQDVTDRSNECHWWGSTVYPLTVKHRAEMKRLALCDTGPDKIVRLSQNAIDVGRKISEDLADNYRH